MKVTIALVSLVLTVLPTLAEEVKVADIRTDTSVTDKYLLFCAKAAAPNSPNGDAFFALGTGDSPTSITIEEGYGTHLDGGRAKMGEISAEVVAKVRNSDETKTFIARIDEKQYATVVGLIEELKAMGKRKLPANVLALEATHMLLIRLKALKKPYRGGSPSQNVQLYYSDLRVLNRNK